MYENRLHYKTEQVEYQERIESELSSYKEKNVHENSSVSELVINDPYFLINDEWNIDFIGSIENFNKEYIKYINTPKNVVKNLTFAFVNPSINLELKYIFYQQMFNGEWSLNYIFSKLSSYQKKLSKFINEIYPRLSSLLDLDVKKAEEKWIKWLVQSGHSTIQTIIQKETGKRYTAKKDIANFLNLMYTYLLRQIDTREEWRKDIWDVRILQEKFGIKYNTSSDPHYIDFKKIQNSNIRIETKRYLKQRLLSNQNIKWSTAVNYMKYLPGFINFIISLETKWTTLYNLTREHIEKYIAWLYKYTRENLKQKNANPKNYIKTAIIIARKYLEDIQNFDYSIAPKKNVRVLFFRSDIPKQDKKPYDQIDYIPDYVLEQLFENINFLPSEIQTIVWIAFKTGMRISDTLGLTQSCLVKLNEKYQIVTDIEKTYVKGHSIPVDDELADMVAVLINKAKKEGNQDNNPEKYIFVRYRGKRKGKPYTRAWIQKKLNILAGERNIKDENGNLFHFKNHQFRHTYAVKMLNGGTDILTVQELLAHASPEMTLRYARLLDNTKRKAFENAVKQGIFSFDLNGKVYEISETEEIPQDILEMLWRDQKLTAIDNPYGSCRARLNGNCPYAEEPPCLTCNGGSPCKDLAVGLSEMDVAKYELHIQSTSKMIKVANQYSRKEIAEKNQKNLERLEDIYSTIKKGNIIFGRLERIKRKQGVTNG